MDATKVQKSSIFEKLSFLGIRLKSIWRPQKWIYNFFLWEVIICKISGYYWGSIFTLFWGSLGGFIMALCRWSKILFVNFHFPKVLLLYQRRVITHFWTSSIFYVGNMSWFLLVFLAPPLSSLIEIEVSQFTNLPKL